MSHGPRPQPEHEPPFWRQLRRVGIAVHAAPIGSIWRWPSWPGAV